MTVRRVMGIETEYGIAMPGHPRANPMILSGQVVTAYAKSRGITAARTLWDFEDEAPLHDARGFQLRRGLAHPSQLTDEGYDDDPTMANVVLTNGARLYVDHAHPEYSSPEVTSPRDAVVWDRAGEVIMAEAVALLASSPPGVNLYKNNTDGKGSSYGTHENYLMARSTPFADIVAHLTPFFVVRQVLCGAGRVGIGVDSREPGYQIASRSDFFEVEVGLETTLKRPIINTRDEPHALAEKYRRLHVILGDANHGDVPNLLKLGTTSLVLAMIEDGFFDRTGAALSVRDPVGTLRRVSHDPDLATLVELMDGRRLTAVELLGHYRELADQYLQQRYGGQIDPDTAEVMHWWGVVLDKLATDPMSAHGEVDWVAKRAVLEAYRSRGGLDWSDPHLRAIDIQWSDVRADKGLFATMAARGRFTSLVSTDEVDRAVTNPPEDTRAWFRGTCLSRFPESVVSASWDSVILNSGHGPLKRVPMLEPLRGTKAQVEDLFAHAEDAAALLAGLTGGSEPPI
ncbi:MAG: depupylase/deamidase Dop [Nostocoides sp.]